MELKPGDMVNIDRTRVGGTHERYLVMDVAPAPFDSQVTTFTLLQDPESP